MKDTREIAALRTMLKNVNVEHSAALKSKRSAEQLARLAELRRQRQVLMAHIAELRRNLRQDAGAATAAYGRRHRAPGPAVHTGVLAMMGDAVASATGTLQRYWAEWARGAPGRTHV